MRDSTFSLENTSEIHVIGFGKASCEAALALEEVLGDALDSGVAIDINTKTCDLIETIQADHPKPSEANVQAAQQVVDLAHKVDEDDLVIVTVSGGGSALLCWPLSECRQSQVLYEEFLAAGGTIQELNTVRKHLSDLKGGGLAKVLNPATVVGLVFSDVPGGELSDVASGPTFYDESTAEDARKILKKYDINEGFEFSETPKDKSYFEDVHNIGLVTNSVALDAMVQKADDLGFTSSVLSTQMYDYAAPTAEQFITETEPGEVSVGGGEIRLVVDEDGGDGGRNQYLVNEALAHIDREGGLFISAASDGVDNTEAAGAIADKQTLKKIQNKDLDYADYLANYDSGSLFQETGDLIYTGQTGANVADIMMYMRHE